MNQTKNVAPPEKKTRFKGLWPVIIDITSFPNNFLNITLGSKGSKMLNVKVFLLHHVWIFVVLVAVVYRHIFLFTSKIIAALLFLMSIYLCIYGALQ